MGSIPPLWHTTLSIMPFSMPISTITTCGSSWGMPLNMEYTSGRAALRTILAMGDASASWFRESYRLYSPGFRSSKWLRGFP